MLTTKDRDNIAEATQRLSQVPPSRFDELLQFRDKALPSGSSRLVHSPIPGSWYIGIPLPFLANIDRTGGFGIILPNFFFPIYNELGHTVLLGVPLLTFVWLPPDGKWGLIFPELSAAYRLIE